MLQFISLASGSDGNCYYMRCDGYGLIIDLGIGIRKFKRAFSDYGLQLAQIRAMLVTHDHTDHVKAVGALSQEFRIPVYTSKKVHASMQANHYFAKKVPAEFQQIITHGTPFDLGPFHITAFFVPHDSAENNGYLIEVEDKKFVIMTDIGHFTEEMPDFVSQATHLIIESNYEPGMLEGGRYPARLKGRISGPNGHISNGETAHFLAQHLSPERIQYIWLCHLSAENNLPRLAQDASVQALTEAGFTLNEGDSPRLQVLPRRTPTLLMDL